MRAVIVESSASQVGNTRRNALDRTSSRQTYSPCRPEPSPDHEPLLILPGLLREIAQEADNAAPRLLVLHSRQFHPGAGKQLLRRGDELVDSCFVPDDARLPQIF